MDTSKVRADYEQLSAIAQVFGQQAEAVQGLLGRLEKARGVLEGGKWKGKGSAAFYREMSQTVLPAMGRLAAAMSEAANVTRKMSRIMKRAEDDAAACFKLNGASGLPDQSAGSTAASETTGGGKSPPAAPGPSPASNQTPIIPKSQGGDGVHPSDVAQGQNNDCFLMAALAALASTPEGRKKIEQMIRRNPDGTYTVTFKERKTDAEIMTERMSQFPPKLHVDPYKNREVTVTPNFPPGSATPDEAGEIWVPLIEQAYGQAYAPGGYSGGDVAEAMERITGQPSQVSSPGKVTLQDLANHLAQGHAIAADTPNDKTVTLFGQTIDIVDVTDWHPAYTSNKIVPWHSYYVTGVDVATNTVTLRNPWGWNGGQAITMTVEEFQQVFDDVSISPVK